MKKIFLLFAFAIAALCAINVEARQTDEFPEEDENRDAARIAAALRLMRIAGRTQRGINRVQNQLRVLRQQRIQRDEALQPIPRPVPQAFADHAPAPAAAEFFEDHEAPNAPLRPHRVAQRDENENSQPRNLLERY